LPSDLLWKDGLKQWVRADKSSIVFPSLDADALVATPRDTSPASPVYPSGTTSTKSTIASAGSLIAKKTERVKLATVTIPLAYVALGKFLYKDLSRSHLFPELIGQLDALTAERKRLQEDAKARPLATTLPGKAKKFATEASDLARTRAIDLQAHKVFASLGESAFRQLGESAGPKDVVEPLVTALAKCEVLDQDMATIEDSAGGQWITPRRLVIASSVLLGLTVLAMISPSLRDGGDGRKPKPSPDAVTVVSGRINADQQPNRDPRPTVETVSTKTPEKTHVAPVPTNITTTSTHEDKKRVSTQKTYYPNGQLHEEISLANETQDGISRAWYSNGCLRDEMTFKNGVLVAGKYLSRTGKKIYEYQMTRGWLPHVSSYDFAEGPDGQPVRPYTDTHEIIPQIDTQKESFGSVARVDAHANKPKDGWPMISLEARVYTDEDIGDVFHGVVKWKTLNGLQVADFKFDDATSMKYSGEGSIAHVAGRRHGPFRLSYPSGAKWVEATFANNVLHGTATVWYENGKKRDVIPFQGGQWDGTYLAWHEGGQKAREIAFVKDKREGIRRAWNKEGMLVEEGPFRGGVKEGLHKAWWPNGTLASERNYANGELHGTSREWNERGVLVVDVPYKNGIPQGSKNFQSVVSRLRDAGFSIQPGTVIQTADGFRHLGSAIGIKSDGENDLVVCIGEFKPVRKDAFSDAEPAKDAIVSRSVLAQHVGYMLSSIMRMPDPINESLTFTDPKRRSGLKTTQNGSTEFVGIMLFGDRQCEVTWSADSRSSPSPEIWKVERDQRLIMIGSDYHTDQRPSITAIIKDLISGASVD
jgi:antitoxin component YwqK of YwqJK toxin-antitoxin module